MTTIICDSNGMAADKLITDGCTKDTTCKIVRINGSLFGLAGDIAQSQRLLKYVCNHRDEDEYDDALVSEACILRLYDSSIVKLYNGSMYGIIITSRVAAIGSGASAALAAYACGKTIVECVEIAAKIDLYTGGGVDYLERL